MAERHAALEAEIATDCDRPEPYLIYADWLQSRGDVRGTLIALQDAARRDGANGKAARMAAELLETDGAVLAGALHMRNDLELTWFQGFVRSIRIRGETIQQILSALRALRATPAGTFVQAIWIDHAEEIDRVVSLLLTERQARTLRRLSIGRPSQWSVPPEVITAYPGLALDPVTAWTKALEEARAQRATPLGLDTAGLPSLEPREGMRPAEVTTILVGLRAELAKKRPIGMVHALPLAVTCESLDRFALALAQQWETVDTPGTKWAFDAVGALGGDRCVEYLGNRFNTWSHPRALQVLDHLRQIGNDAAITELLRLGMPVAQEQQPRRLEARSALELVALTRNLDSLTQLIARCCPRGGTDGDVVRVLAVQRSWLEELMIGGQRLTPTDFREHVVLHSLRKPLAAGLVWGGFVDGTLHTLFMIDAIPELPAGSMIGVVHPLELSEAQRTEWREAAALRGIAPPFTQLDRPLFALTAAEAPTDQLDRYAMRRVGFATLVPRLVARGWYPHEDYDGASYQRDLARDDVIVRAKLDAGAACLVYLRRGSFWQNRRFDLHHQVTISELLYDLEIAHGGVAAVPV